MISNMNPDAMNAIAESPTATLWLMMRLLRAIHRQQATGDALNAISQEIANRQRAAEEFRHRHAPPEPPDELKEPF